ncbi:MAG: hypothetical protein ABIR16_07555 [Dokdonella sp.]
MSSQTSENKGSRPAALSALDSAAGIAGDGTTMAPIRAPWSMLNL